jgi:poly(ADP-ribose) glycohydrolase ARH3
MSQTSSAAAPVPDLRDRFRGCLLGQAVADAVAAPFEGLSDDILYEEFGPAAGILRNPPEKTFQYTDDTQMMIGVAETLADLGRIDEDALAARFAANYDPGRGYGQGARKVIAAMIEGGDWRTLAATVFPGGSLGNGAAMRAAPVGLLFHDDLDRVAEEAERSARPTHVHPVGIDGARKALAVALAVRGPPLSVGAFYGELLARAKTDEFRWPLDIASRLRLDQSVSVLGGRLEAHRSVVTSLASFALSPDSYEGAVSRAMDVGDDVDTLAAMAGALSGAHLGLSAVPLHLLKGLEDGPQGRGYITSLADRLSDRFAERTRPAG